MRQCCQLLAELELSGQSGGKIRQLKKKSNPFLKAFRLLKQFFSVSVIGKSITFLVIYKNYTEQGAGKFFLNKKLSTFLALTVQNWPKFGDWFVRLLYFLFGF
jgi:hypothetical protein